MLPDGAHNRTQETTYFMIRRVNVDSTEEFHTDERLKIEEMKQTEKSYLREDFF